MCVFPMVIEYINCMYKCQVGESDDFADQQISNKFFERDLLKSWRTDFLKNNKKIFEPTLTIERAMEAVSH